MITNVYWSAHEVTVFLSDINETWIFSTDIRNILKYQNFMNVSLLGQTNGQTDRETWRS